MGLVGLTILIWEGRPVFFAHYRVGKDGRLFWLPKLRTLRPGADPYKPPTESDVAQMVRASGKFLRRHRIDELPQLLPVLTGRMSLVGPRPEIPNVVATYRRIYRKRLSVKPGITGLWQIMADHNNKADHDIKYDLYYLRRASLWFDMRILAMTIPFVLGPK
jgi:lipopolysaccharide/colanic/teichoic acid biosynthesis glycosyltransferase